MTKYPEPNCDHYILNELPDNAELSKYPSEYWVLHLYVIVLKQQASAYYPLLDSGDFLVLEHPSYADHNRSIWSTPYLAYRIDVGTKRFNRVSGIKKMYDEQCKSKADLLAELTNYRFYHMGISSYEFEDGRTYIEYKRSPRQPDTWKCYFIKERFVYNIDSLGLQNLVDPEGLHAYSYFPIRTVRNEYTVYGKPLSTNVVHLLKDNYITLKSKAEAVDLGTFKTKFKGYMLKFDITSFAKMMHEIENDYKSFERTGVQYSEAFIIYLQQIFEQELLKASVSQYRLEGDGFLASIETPSTNCDIEYDIISAFKTISKRISDLLGSNKLSYRASLLFGEYDYGKELGLFSKGLVHSGKELIRLTRMDSAIREHINSDTDKTPRLFFLADLKLCDKDNKNFLAGFSNISSIDSFRETAINANLYSLKMEEIL